MEQRVSTRSAELRAAVFDAPDLPAADVFDYVFAEPTPELAAQRAQLAAELAREG
jgi:pyruvate dehydrogenase E1 component alpha subunit